MLGFIWSEEIEKLMKKIKGKDEDKDIPLLEKVENAEQKRMELLLDASDWFLSLSDEDKKTLSDALRPCAAKILNCPYQTRCRIVYGILTAFILFSAGAFLAGGIWSVLGIITLGSGWILFRGVEKRHGENVSFIDPLSSALVSELYSEVLKEGIISPSVTPPVPPVSVLAPGFFSKSEDETEPSGTDCDNPS